MLKGRNAKSFCVWLALGVFVLWAAIALAQLWTSFLNDDLFGKISISALIVVVVAVIVFVVLREVVDDAQLEQDDYLG